MYSFGYTALKSHSLCSKHCNALSICLLCFSGHLLHANTYLIQTPEFSALRAFHLAVGAHSAHGQGQQKSGELMSLKNLHR